MIKASLLGDALFSQVLNIYYSYCLLVKIRELLKQFSH